MSLNEVMTLGTVLCETKAVNLKIWETERVIKRVITTSVTQTMEIEDSDC